MKHICILFICCLSSAFCHGQCFTGRYTKLDEGNLESFFYDWQEWSKEIATKEYEDSLHILLDVMSRFTLHEYKKEKKTKIKQLKKNLAIIRKDKSIFSISKTDSIKNELSYLMKENVLTGYYCQQDSLVVFVYKYPYSMSDDGSQRYEQKFYICPSTNRDIRTLFLTSRISNLLEGFCGGMSKLDIKTMTYPPFSPINQKGIDELRNRIPVNPIATGWSFLSCPHIYGICLYPNGKRILVSKTADTTYELFLPHGKITKNNIIRSLETIWD